MKNILIISSTKNTNFQLSKEIKAFFNDKNDVDCSLINLEDFNLPLFTPTLEKNFKDNKNFPDNIGKIKEFIVSSNGIIWCSPEYNGGISPILTNMIAWISRATDDWKEGFQNKNSLICSSSGGNGTNFVKGFTLQLNYLGSVVMDCSIIRTNKKDIDKAEFSETLSKFYQTI